MTRSVKALAEELRFLADLCEANPMFAEELQWSVGSLALWPSGTKEKLESALNNFISVGMDATRGDADRKVEKIYNDYSAGAKFRLGDMIQVSMYIAREEVCEKVELDEEETIEIVDPNWVRPTPPKITVTRKKTDWECKPMRRIETKKELPAGDGILDAEVVDDA